MEKTPDGWTVAARVWLVKNYIVAVYGLAGGTVTVFLAIRWSSFLALYPIERIILVIFCGFIAIAFLIGFDYFRKPKIKGTLTPVTMNNAEARVTFKNNGRKADFFVKCEFTGQVNIPNTLPNVVYDLAWENQIGKVLSVTEGDSAHLILATWKFESLVNNYYGKNVEQKLGIAEFRAVGKEEPEHRMVWHCELKAHLPACDIKVTVLSDGGRGKLEQFFTVEPLYYHGPLQISEYIPTGKDGKRVRL